MASSEESRSIGESVLGRSDPTRAVPHERDRCIRPPVSREGRKCRSANPERSVGRESRSPSPAVCVVTSLCSRQAPVKPKTPPGASRGLGSSHSILIGDGAVVPPRSGFVLRLCIRKADGVGVRPCSTTALRIQASAERLPLAVGFCPFEIPHPCRSAI